jgi:hypothetical protein
MRRNGSQFRERLESAGYELVERINSRSIVVRCGGRLELWVRNNHHAGYTLEYKGQGYEFVREYC